VAVSEENRARAALVFARMREGLSLRRACAAEGWDHAALLKLLPEDEDLAHQYARAREDCQDAIAEEIIAIADEDPGTTPVGGTDSGAVQHQRLRVDARKWLLSKLAPKRYGDRLEVAGDPDAPMRTHLSVEFVKPKAP
jgi:hypothetical protein